MQWLDSIQQTRKFVSPSQLHELKDSDQRAAISDARETFLDVVGMLKGRAPEGVELPKIGDTLGALARRMHAPDFCQRKVQDTSTAGVLGDDNFLNIVRQAVIYVMRSPVHPTYFVQTLLENMPYDPQAQIYLGGLNTAAVQVVPRGADLPTTTPAIANGPKVGTEPSRYGVKLALDADFRQSSMWGILGMYLNEIAYGFQRNREVQALTLLNDSPLDIFNNRNPSSALLHNTTGRNIQGAGNGTLTADDLFRAKALMMQTGYPPDVLIVNPLFWPAMMADPEIRYQIGTPEFFGNYVGEIGEHIFQGSNPLGLGPATGLPFVPGTTGTSGINPSQNSVPVLPKYWATFNGLRVIPSVFVPYDPATNTTNIIMVSSRHSGIFLNKTPVSSFSWSNWEQQVAYMGFQEEFAVANKDEGRGVGVLRSIRCESSALSTRITPMIQVASSALGPISTTEAVVS